MHIRRFLSVLAVTILMSLAMAGVAHAGTLTVKLVMCPQCGNMDGIGRQVMVYGPGYYRSAWAPWPGAYQSNSMTFYNAPSGAYRIRVYSSFYGRDTNNQYPNFNFAWWNGYKASFTMQR